MNDIRVIDNFLDKNNLTKLQDMIMDKNFPWYISSSSDYENDNNTQLTHLLYNNHVSFSDYFPKFYKIYDKLEVFALYKIRLIATMKYNGIENIYHKDIEKIQHPNNCTTAVFYLNDNDGGTQFECNNEIIKSKENRMVIFPTILRHRTVKHTTDLPFRYVLNINYVGIF